MANEEQFCFLADWYDSQACLNRRYNLIYHLGDKSVELFDAKTRKTFLKRCRLDNVLLSDLYIGNMVTVMSRTMKIIDYGDDYTRRSLLNNQQKAYGVISSSSFNKLGQILSSINESGVKVAKLRQVKLSSQEVYQILDSMRDKENFNNCVRSLSDGPIIVLELFGEDAQRKWNSLSDNGFDDAVLERLSYSVLQAKNAGKNTSGFDDSTCCIIKPHIVSSNMTGAVIYEIQRAGYEIAVIMSVNFTKPNAEEFLEVYKGVVPDYSEMVDELINGTCIALEVRDPQGSFRQFCGPVDPEIARTLRPNTLRALFGLDKIKNSVHCTDLPEDASLEVDYFFRILDSN